MKIQKLLIVITILLPNFGNTQDRTEIEISEGLIFFNALTHPNNYARHQTALGTQNDFAIWRAIDFNRTFNGRMGIGITNYFYIDEEYYLNGNSTTSYIAAKVGLDINTFWSPMQAMVVYNKYILLHKEKQENGQQRTFANIDLGLRFQMNKRMQLSISSPITLHPLQTGTIGYTLPGQQRVIYDLWVETIGVNIGLKYSFGAYE